MSDDERTSYGSRLLLVTIAIVAATTLGVAIWALNKSPPTQVRSVDANYDVRQPAKSLDRKH